MKPAADEVLGVECALPPGFRPFDEHTTPGVTTAVMKPKRSTATDRLCSGIASYLHWALPMR